LDFRDGDGDGGGVDRRQSLADKIDPQAANLRRGRTARPTDGRRTTDVRQTPFIDDKTIGRERGKKRYGDDGLASSAKSWR